MEITIYVALIWISAILVGTLDLVIFLGSRTLSSRAFVHSILWVTIWIFSVGLFVASTDYQTALFFSRLTYYLGTVIAASFLYFFITYPEDKKPIYLFSWSLIILEILFGYVFIFTNKIIFSLFPINAPHPWGWFFGHWSPIFEISFFGFFIAGIIILYRKFKKHKESGIKENLKYMLWTIVVGATPPSILSIILPRFGYFGLNWLGPATEIIWIPIIAYSIIRYRQMDVRVVVTEVLAIGMAVIFFVNIFIETSFGSWSRVGTFMIFLATAYFLVRTTLKEAQQREELNSLNLHLEQKVAEQTADVRRAYEVEKKARRDLEKLNDSKNQFIMITQHHLRTPVTTIDWELESMLSGTHGHVTPELKTAITDAQTASRRLTHIIDDFLNIAALKAGGSILNLSRKSLKPSITDVINELKLDITRLHLKTTYSLDDADWPPIVCDCDKIQEILLIVIENAVKYNRDGGSIDVNTKTRGNQFEISIENSGIGMTKEEAEKIGSALFFRGSSARAANPTGMGIGLSVVKAVVRAHHGTFSIKSSGTGKGAVATMVLPLEQPYAA